MVGKYGRMPAQADAGSWPEGEARAGDEMVRLSRETGSGWQSFRTALLTHRGSLRGPLLGSFPPAPFACELGGRFRHPSGAFFPGPVSKRPHELAVAEGP